MMGMQAIYVSRQVSVVSHHSAVVGRQPGVASRSTSAVSGAFAQRMSERDQ
jgi:hypothetical protein